MTPLMALPEKSINRCSLSCSDHALIAKEMARMLGLGTNILTAEGLPNLSADGKIPDDLGEKYGEHIVSN